VHGNAILTRYYIEDARALVHRKQPLDWAEHGEVRPCPHLSTNDQHVCCQACGEPRKGQRVTLYAKIQTPLGAIDCYCVHLEIYCGKDICIGV
jgi:endonuclease/exonuclease/phosphatase family metal-dependent hydrolase